MCDTPFKTPLPCRRPKLDSDETPKNTSDSEESTTSDSNSAGAANTQSSDEGLSIVAELDDLMRMVRYLKTDRKAYDGYFINLVEQMQKLMAELDTAVRECRRLQNLVDEKTHSCTDLEHKLDKARTLIDNEKVMTRNARKERDELLMQLDLIRDVLFQDKDPNRLPEETRHKLSFLNNNYRSATGRDLQNGGFEAQLSAIKEVNSTGSILSDLSYSRSEDDLDNSVLGRGWKNHRPSSGGVSEPAIKKRRSSGHKVVEINATDTVRATTTLTVNKEGPITATSIIESVPKSLAESAGTNIHLTPSAPPANLVFESWARDSPRKPDRRPSSRQHCFQQKTLVMPDTCGVCEKRIRFGKTSMKCKDCKAICHLECKDNLPVPCIPVVNTPNHRNVMGVIGDYTPTTPPMVPPLLIHCINEIELRGMNEIGLYRIPGAERDVKSLKERFLRGKGAPCLNQVDIHVICGTVKDFLRSLQESIITYGLWKDFVNAVDARDRADAMPAVYEAISKLPQPNRDTLAYMILHLQKVSQSRECKMSTTNLAKIFGPTIVGYSSDDPNPANLMNEMLLHNKVMEYLLNIPSDYWAFFINSETSFQPSKLQQTPSTDSLLRHTTTRGLFTPNRNLLKRKQKYFPSPK